MLPLEGTQKTEGFFLVQLCFSHENLFSEFTTNVCPSLLINQGKSEKDEKNHTSSIDDNSIHKACN